MFDVLWKLEVCFIKLSELNFLWKKDIYANINTSPSHYLFNDEWEYSPYEYTLHVFNIEAGAN